MKNILKRAVSAVVAVYRANPARGNALAVAAIVAVASAIGVVVDSQSALHVIAIVIPILLGGELTHRKVTPA